MKNQDNDIKRKLADKKKLQQIILIAWCLIKLILNVIH